MEVDSRALDPKCRASLLVSLEDGSLTSEPYPLTAHEPPLLVIDAATEAAMSMPGSDKEIKDPQDYVPEEHHHNLLAQFRCYISTDASADAELALRKIVDEHKVKVFDAQNAPRVRVGLGEHTHAPTLVAARQGLALAEAQLAANPQSKELLADHVKVTFDPTACLWRVEAT